MRERVRVFGAIVRDPRLLRIQLAFLGFNMAEYATWIAILVYAYERAGARGAGVMALVQLLPAAAVAPLAAYAGDRFRRDRVLFVGYLAEAASVGAAAVVLSLDLPIAFVYGAATVAAVSMTFTRPAQASLLPAVTRTPEDLTAANVVSGVAEGAGIMAGPFVAGLILRVADPGAVFAVFAAVSLVGAALTARLGIDPRAVTPSEPLEATDVWRGTLGGFRVLRRERGARLIVFLLASSIAIVGALDVLIVAAAIDLLGIGQAGAGFLNAAFGIGGIVGAAAAAALVGVRRLTPPLTGGAVGFGIPIAAVGVAPSATTAPVLIAIGGAGRSVAYVAGQTLLQRIAPDEVLARVFGVLEGLAMLALALGSVGASALVEAFGIETALIVVGASVPLGVLLVAGPLLSIDRHAKAPDPRFLRIVCKIPIFAPLPAPAVERLMANLVHVTAETGEAIIREGDRGDTFYVLVEGAAEVTRDGELVAERGPGDYFGEIALLRDVPRTATVTATTPVALLALDRESFLEAVTGHPQSRRSAEAIVRERLDPRS
jgi:MFS family permease